MVTFRLSPGLFGLFGLLLGPAIPGKSLTERVEALIARQESLAAMAESTGQIIPAVAALREVRACLEQIGKLSGELSLQNINFFNIDLTENRIQEFLDAAALRGPQVGQFVRDQALKRFGQAVPNIQISFVSPDKVRQQKTLEALPAAAAQSEAT
jgi:hypothetical protein